MSGTTWGDVWDNVGEYRDNFGGRLGQLEILGGAKK